MDRIGVLAGCGSERASAFAGIDSLYGVDRIAVLAVQLTAGMVPDGYVVEKWTVFRLYVDYGHRYG